MTMEPDDSDLGVRVQRRFARLEAGLDEPPRPTAPEPVVADSGRAAEVANTVREALAASVAQITAHLDEQLDVLRHELEAAFDEVISRLEATDRAVRALHERPDAVDRGTGPVEVDLSPIVPPLASLDEKLRAIGRMLEAQDPASAPREEAPDVTPMLQALGRELASQRSDLSRIAHALHTTKDDGTEVDMAYLEEVVRRGAVANAADIANLRTDVEVLTGTLREQATTLTELRKQTEWIRQRLLGR